MTAVSFAWWDRQDPETFLDFNRDHPSRSIACGAAIALAQRWDGTLLEVGPGAGIDYYRAFQAVDGHGISYTGCEPTPRFFAALCQRYPLAQWRPWALADVPAGSAAVVYARAVLEHQPALQPGLGQLLAAARHAVVIDWYRPPEPHARCEWVDEVPCHTFARAEVLAAVSDAGFRVTEVRLAERNEVWAMERR